MKIKNTIEIEIEIIDLTLRKIVENIEHERKSRKYHG